MEDERRRDRERERRPLVRELSLMMKIVVTLDWRSGAPFWVRGGMKTRAINGDVMIYLLLYVSWRHTPDICIMKMLQLVIVIC